jgi:hypothetical protein
MRLAPLYQQDRQLAMEQGRQIEGVSLILRQLNRRIGVIPANLTEQISQLPIEALENLGEALLDFENETDLVNWLEQDR